VKYFPRTNRVARWFGASRNVGGPLPTII